MGINGGICTGENVTDVVEMIIASDDLSANVTRKRLTVRASHLVALRRQLADCRTGLDSQEDEHPTL